MAKTQYFPTLNLSGLLGLRAIGIDNLFSDSADTYTATSSLLTPLFYFGRIQANVEQARALRQQAKVQYRRNVQTAFREVRDALTFLNIANQRLNARRKQIVALRRTLALARIRYKAGYSGFIEVLDAERRLLGAELAATRADRDRYIATANLFRALGGGWLGEEIENLPSNKTAVPANKTPRKIQPVRASSGKRIAQTNKTDTANVPTQKAPEATGAKSTRAAKPVKGNASAEQVAIAAPPAERLADKPHPAKARQPNSPSAIPLPSSPPVTEKQVIPLESTPGGWAVQVGSFSERD
ncbi:MAG: TolC family protein, partial [Pseudomonadota bacterium]|nr:TolC family protein [Pseudomonadota bacterium]